MTNTPTYRLLFWVLALSGLALDLGSKYYLFHDLRGVPGHSREVVPGVFSLVAHRQDDGSPYVNQGALFGFLQDRGDIANMLFAAISLAAAVAIVFWIGPKSANDRWMTVSLGLILGGTLGNFWDRVAFGGVRDFLHVFYVNAEGQRVFDWPVFNVADCWLVAGACLLLLLAFRPQPAEKPVAEAEGSPEPAAADVA